MLKTTQTTTFVYQSLELLDHPAVWPKRLDKKAPLILGSEGLFLAMQRFISKLSWSQLLLPLLQHPPQPQLLLLVLGSGSPERPRHPHRPF